MLRIILLSLIIVVPGISQAKWVEIDQDEEFKYFIDPERSLITNDSLQYAETWIKQVIHTDLTKDGLSVGDHRLAKYNFRCNSRELSLAAVYDYRKGEVLNSYVPSYAKFKPAIPDSRGEFFLELVCQSR